MKFTITETAEYEVEAASAEGALEVFEDDGPELGPGVTLVGVTAREVKPA